MARLMRSYIRTLLKRLYWRANAVLGSGTALVAPPDLRTYRETQTAGNKRKIAQVFAVEANIACIAAYAEACAGPVRSVLCHGTRNGAELQWFGKCLPHARILGTDISDTANQFPNTVQWDFHERNPEWIGQFDLIYSNSWDHAHDPRRAFAAWLECLSARGLLVLEHAVNHLPRRATPLDPFGATVGGLRKMLEQIDAPTWKVREVIDLPICAKQQKAVIVGRL